MEAFEQMLFDFEHYDISVVSPKQYEGLVVEAFGAAGTVFFLTDEQRTGDFIVELVDLSQEVRHRIRFDVFRRMLDVAYAKLKGLDKPDQPT